MKYPENMPLTFSNQKSFVEINGNEVWESLCDLIMLGQWVNIREIADSIPSLQGYSKINRHRYLTVVLNAVIINNAEAGEPPLLEKRSKRLEWFKLI